MNAAKSYAAKLAKDITRTTMSDFEKLISLKDDKIDKLQTTLDLLVGHIERQDEKIDEMSDIIQKIVGNSETPPRRCPKTKRVLIPKNRKTECGNF